MRLDYQILLKSHPLTLLVGSAPDVHTTYFHMNITFVSSLFIFFQTNLQFYHGL